MSYSSICLSIKCLIIVLQGTAIDNFVLAGSHLSSRELRRCFSGVGATVVFVAKGNTLARGINRKCISNVIECAAS